MKNLIRSILFFACILGMLPIYSPAQESETNMIGKNISASPALERIATHWTKGTMSGIQSQLALSPDGNTLLVATETDGYTLWDTRSSNLLRAYNSAEDNSSDTTWVFGPIDNAEFTPDNQRVVIFGYNLVELDLSSHSPSNVIEFPYGSGTLRPSELFRLSPNGEYMAFWSVGQGHRAIQIYDRKTGLLHQNFSLDTLESWVLDLKYFPDGKHLLSMNAFTDGSDTCVLYLWDIENAKLERTYPGISGTLNVLGVSQSGKKFAICGYDRLNSEAKIFNYTVSNGFAGTYGHFPDNVYGSKLVFSHDDTKIICLLNGLQQKLAILNASDGSVFNIFDASAFFAVPSYTDFELAPNDSIVYMASDSIVCLNIYTGTANYISTTSGGWLYDIDFTPDNKFITLSPSGSRIRDYDVDNGKAYASDGKNINVPFGMRKIAYSRDGRFMAYGDRTGSGQNRAVVYVKNMQTNEVVWQSDTSWHQTLPIDMAFTPNSRYFAFGGTEFSWEDHARAFVIDLVSLDTFSVSYLYDNWTDLYSISVSSDNKAIAFTSCDLPYIPQGLSYGQTYLFNTETKGVTVVSDFLVFAPAKNRAAVATGYKAMFLNVFEYTDPNDYSTYKVVNSHPFWTNNEIRVVSDMVFSADGKRLFTAGHDSGITVWDVETMSEIALFDARPFYPDRIQLSADNRHLAARHLRRGVAMMWDVPDRILSVEESDETNTASANQYFSVYPQPSSEATTLQFTMQTTGNVRCVLYDLLGRAVLEVPTEVYHAGEQTIRLNTEFLRAGVYSAVLTIDGQQFSRRIVIAR